MTASQAQPSSLQEVAGTIVLIGAGKMGAAMLDGWIALGLEPSRLIMIQPGFREPDEVLGEVNP